MIDCGSKNGPWIYQYVSYDHETDFFGFFGKFFIHYNMLGYPIASEGKTYIGMLDSCSLKISRFINLETTREVCYSETYVRRKNRPPWWDRYLQAPQMHMVISHTCGQHALTPEEIRPNAPAFLLVANWNKFSTYFQNSVGRKISGKRYKCNTYWLILSSQSYSGARGTFFLGGGWVFGFPWIFFDICVALP